MKRKIKFKLDKLVRDRIPEFFQLEFIEITSRILDKDEYIESLKNKLLEETHEVLEAKDEDSLKEELADLLEVMKSLAAACNFSFEDIERIRIQKKLYKGGFEDKVYIDFIEADEDNKHIDYYLSSPAKYPIIK